MCLFDRGHHGCVLGINVALFLNLFRHVLRISLRKCFAYLPWWGYFGNLVWLPTFCKGIVDSCNCGLVGVASGSSENLWRVILRILRNGESLSRAFRSLYSPHLGLLSWLISLLWPFLFSKLSFLLFFQFSTFCLLLAFLLLHNGQRWRNFKWCR